MRRYRENITRNEKLKIGGIIGIAALIVSLMILSSFEAQLQQTVETVLIFFYRIFNYLS